MTGKRILKNSKHACNRCRASKVRCLVDTFAEHRKCRKCYESNKECIFDGMVVRPRRERADVRLKILEREIEALKTRFRPSSRDSHSPCHSKNMSHGISDDIAEDHDSIPLTEAERECMNSSDVASNQSILHSAFLSQTDAKTHFDSFVKHSLPQYPILVFDRCPDFISFERAKPLLTFAMTTAALRATDPSLFSRLHLRLTRILAEEVVVGGNRNLELLQALLIAEVWYDPPDDLNRLNFYMWLQIAANMALQLGLWWDTEILSAITNNKATEEQLEKWRTALAVYLSVSAVSVSLQHPRSESFSLDARTTLAKFTVNAVEIGDKRLAAWTSLQLVAEEIENMRIQIGCQTGWSDSDFLLIFSKLQGRLALYEKTTELNDALLVHYSYVVLKMNELYVAYDIERIRYLASADQALGEDIQLNYEEDLLRLIRSCHDLLESVLCMDSKVYLNSPTVTTVRALYAVKTLVMLEERHVRSKSMNIRFDIRDVLRLGVYSQRLEHFFHEMKGNHEHRIPRMALVAIHRLREDETRGNGNIASNHSYHLPPKNAGLGHASCVSHTTSDDLEAVTNPTLFGSTALKEETRQDQSLNETKLQDYRYEDQSATADATPMLDASFWNMFAVGTESSLDAIWSPVDAYYFKA